jgi:predicted hydrocarbon binding protein
VHGLILVSLRDYLQAVNGGRHAAEMLADSDSHLVSEAYPDEEFDGLLERACAATGTGREALLRDFGSFTAEHTFARLYPDLFNVASTARTFVLNVERPIHELVRVAMPNARPPELAVSELGEQGVAIVYRSRRRLCAFLTGLVAGTARHYGEVARIEQRTCMHRGDDACTFEVRFERDPFASPGYGRGGQQRPAAVDH